MLDYNKYIIKKEGSYIVMEIGVGALLVLIGLSVYWVESTKTGTRFINWFGKKFFDIDLDVMED